MATAPDFEPATPRRRHDGWSAARQIRFIQAIAEGATVDAAARSVGMTRDSAYKLARRPCGLSFRRGWEAARDCNIPQLEQAVLERSINGVPRPIFYKGEQVGEWRHFDEKLAMFLLRSRRPDRYGKWIDLIPGPDLDEHEDDGAIRLDGPITEIDFNGPEDGNDLDDIDDDDQDRETPPA
jgi:hypothetical protein